MFPRCFVDCDSGPEREIGPERYHDGVQLGRCPLDFVQDAEELGELLCVQTGI